VTKLEVLTAKRVVLLWRCFVKTSFSVASSLVEKSVSRHEKPMKELVIVAF
jgi:hypothetical protein